MKYEKKYQSIMEKECKRAIKEKERTTDKFYQEWIAILGALVYPEQHPKAIVEQLKKDWKISISYEDYMRNLRSVNLDSIAKRTYMVETIKQAAENLVNALNGEKEAALQFAEFVSNLVERDSKDRKLYFKAKYLLVYLIMVHDDMKHPEYQVIVEAYGERFCEHIVRALRRELLNTLEIQEKKKSTKDVLKMTEEVLASTETFASADRRNQGDKGNRQASELEQLRFENENFRTSLELLQSMFDELKETVEESAKEAKTIAITEFFSNLNAPVYGNLLDSMLVVEKTLAEARKNGIKMPAQMMPLSIFFKQLLRFIHDSKIEPIEEMGRRFEAVYQEIALMNYIGEPYVRDDEKKLVVVESPGWKYEDILISAPTVKEVAD